MNIREQLVKIGKTHKALRPHIRPVLAALKQASRPYTGYSVKELKRLLWDATSQGGIDGSYMNNLIHDLRAHGVSEHSIDSIISQSRPGKPFPSHLDHSASLKASSQKLAMPLYDIGVEITFPDEQTLIRYIDMNSDIYDEPLEVELERLRDTLERIVTDHVSARKGVKPARRGHRAFIVTVPIQNATSSDDALYQAEAKVKAGIDMVSRLVDRHLAQKMVAVDYWL